MLYEGRVMSMDDSGRAWVTIPSLLGGEEHGPVPVLAHAADGVVIGALVYLSEVANSEDRFVIIGVIP